METRRWKERLNWIVIILLILYFVPASAVQFSAIVRRTLPSAISDGSGGTVRLGRYGEVSSWQAGPPNELFGQEGSYFVAACVQPCTAFAFTGATETLYVATTPNFTIKNGDSLGGKRISIDYVRFTYVTAPTASTAAHFAVVTDTGTRYSSGGTALTAYNANYDSGASSITANLFSGTITATSAATPRYICRGSLKNAIPAVGDSLIVSFGSTPVSSSQAFTGQCGPAIIGPGQSLLVYLWLTAQTGAGTGEVSAAWWER